MLLATLAMRTTGVIASLTLPEAAQHKRAAEYLLRTPPEHLDRR
jgi:hypothetical protein